jgi:hypothetical protein
VQPNKLRTGIIFIGLGAALLLYNLDRLDGSYFVSLLKLWPVLLVAIGIEVLARHSDLKRLGYLSPLLIVGAFVYAGTRESDSWDAFRYSFGSGDEPGRMETIERHFKIDSPVAQARYFVDLYNGKLHIASGGEALGRGTFKSRGKVRTSISDDEGVAVVRVRQSGSARSDDQAQFDLFLSPGLPLTLDLKADDADVNLQAEDLSVQTLFLELARGGAQLTLGRARDSVWTHLSVGSARLKVRLPEGAGIRLEGKDLPEDVRAGQLTFARSGSGLETPGFREATLRFIFDLDRPIADLEFETY